MKHLFSVVCALFLLSGTTNAASDTKFEQDKAAIKSLAGCYKVSFDFAETFAPDSNYKYHERKTDWGIECVIIVEETDQKISFQHLLLVGDGMIIKHWRQDWVYENTSLLAFDKGNVWKQKTIDAKTAKGTWTQKVYQVDDSPRYEGFGTWNHVDGRHFWESTADAPLPRREYTKRDDYNVLVRHSKMEITSYGWVLEQDNAKTIRTDAGDKLLCEEKGYEKFFKGDYDCKPGEGWWAKHKAYWNDVRAVWAEIYAQNKGLNLKAKVDDSALYEKLFAADETFAKAATYDSKGAKVEIRKIIDSFTNK
jgi:hypothetical protein